MATSVTAEQRTAARQAAIGQEVLATLAKLTGQLDGEDTIKTHSGKDIIIPEDMELDAAWRHLRKLATDAEEQYQVNRTFNYLPWDGARAVKHVLKETFGYTMGRSTRGMFGQIIPPQLINIETGVGTTESVPWGRVQLPHFDEGYLDVSGSRDPEYGLIFAVTATCKRKHAKSIEGLFLQIEEFLRENSIYRGKAITATEKPSFIDVSGINPDDVVYTDVVMEEAAVYIWANIWYPESLRDSNQLGKRLTVVHGKYGVGKTLLALVTAHYCMLAYDDPTQEKVTFILVPAGGNWQFAFSLARLYGRCIIFIEDVDTLIDTNDPKQVSMLLDQLDGLRAKGLDASMVFTTNHIDHIHKGALRPGRTDGTIEIGFMDRDGVERLTKRVIPNLDPDIDFDAVFEACEGFTPAYVKEVLDRSIRRNIVRNKGHLTRIDQIDLVHSANSLRPQLALMEAAPEAVKRTGIDGVLTSLVTNAVEEKLNRADIVDSDGDFWGQLRTNG